STGFCRAWRPCRGVEEDAGALLHPSRAPSRSGAQRGRGERADRPRARERTVREGRGRGDALMLACVVWRRGLERQKGRPARFALSSGAMRAVFTPVVLALAGLLSCGGDLPGVIRDEMTTTSQVKAGATTVVLFTDFQCPFCRRTHAAL